LDMWARNLWLSSSSFCFRIMQRIIALWSSKQGLILARTESKARHRKNRSWHKAGPWNFYSVHWYDSATLHISLVFTYCMAYLPSFLCLFVWTVSNFWHSFIPTALTMHHKFFHLSFFWPLSHYLDISKHIPGKPA
jgi:hypothetical protein